MQRECTPGWEFAPHREMDAPQPVLGMHPICTPGKAKCTPPKSEMHPIYETLLNLFVIPKRQVIPYGMACLFDSLGGTRKGGGRKAAVKTVRWTVFSPWESPFRFQTHPIGMWIKSEYFRERIATPVCDTSRNDRFFDSLNAGPCGACIVVYSALSSAGADPSDDLFSAFT